MGTIINDNPDAVFASDENKETMIFYCPGCTRYHGVSVAKGGWVWNGDVVKPTLSPSVIEKRNDTGVCHFFVNDGMIQFQSDCTHDKKGQTMPLVKWTDSP